MKKDPTWNWKGEHPCPNCGLSSRARIVEGPSGRELFASFHPGGDPEGGQCSPEIQLALLGRRRDELLAQFRDDPFVLAAETWYLDPSRVSVSAPTASGASTIVGMPPCCSSCAGVLQIHAYLDCAAGQARALETTSALSGGHVFDDGQGHRHIRLSGIHGTTGAPVEDEYTALLESAETLLAAEGASFKDVVRTWIYLRDIDATYEAFNRVRKDFFDAGKVTLYPASTGIGGRPTSPEYSATLSLHAITGAPPVSSLHSPTFNEAYEYGSCFSRGLRLGVGDRSLLILSGTAAIDEMGRSVGGGDVATQASRMLDNIEGLLAGAGSDFSGVVQAVSYLKRPEDIGDYARVLEASGFLSVPHAVVHADICRPELLCEIEVLATGTPS